MNIRVVREKDEDGMVSFIEIEIDGFREIAIGNLDECPEDATLYRDLSFVQEIPEMLERAYEAGDKGEPFTIIEQNEE